MNSVVATIEKKLGIKDMNIFDAVRHTREALSATTDGRPDPDLTRARSVDLIKSFGVEDVESLGLDSDQTARLFATALVSTLVSNRENFNLDKAIAEARIKVANIESMVGKKTAKKAKAPKPVKEPKAPRNEKPVKKSRSAFDLTKARDIFKADSQARIYDLVTRVAEAYGVDRARAYGLLHKVRKEAN